MTSVTVSMPCHGGTLDTLAEAAGSVLAQTHEEIELVVTNDGGDPAAVRTALGAALDDGRVVVVDVPVSAGRYAADAAVLADCDTDWFCVHDADDRSDPGRIERMLAAATDGVEALIGGYTSHRINGSTNLRRPQPSQVTDQRLGHVTQQCCIIWRTEALRRIGGPHPGWRFAWDTMLIGLTIRHLRWAAVDDYGYHHMQRRGSLSVASPSGMQSQPRRQAINVRSRLWRATAGMQAEETGVWLLAQPPPQTAGVAPSRGEAVKAAPALGPRRLVVVTRVGCRFGTGQVPSEERVRWWARLASEVAAGGIPEQARWVWTTAPEHLELVRTLAPETATVMPQDTREIPNVAGGRFTVVRCDADDRWFPGALDVEMLTSLLPRTAVAYPCGRQIDLDSGVGRALDYRGHHLPPFLAVTQDQRAMMLDVGGQHTEVGRGRNVRQILEPSWLQLVGGWNTANRPNKFGRDDRWPVNQIMKEASMTNDMLAFDGELDRLAARHGTDKGSAPGRGLFPKRYTRAYEALLAPRRDEPLRLLELGVQAGSSIRMWLDYLPDAKVAGVDIKPVPNQLKQAPGRLRYRHFQGEQADPKVLGAALDWLGGEADVVVDDCSHKHADHVASHGILWPRLAAGGWYACEDLHAAPASVDWLKDLGAEFHAEDRLAILHKPSG